MPTHYVLSHPALPSPRLIDAQDHAEVLATIKRQASHVILGSLLLPANGIALIEHDAYRDAEERKLKSSHRYLCAWGNIHENSDTGEHERCKRELLPTNPLVAPKLLAAADDPPPALPPA